MVMLTICQKVSFVLGTVFLIIAIGCGIGAAVTRNALTITWTAENSQSMTLTPTSVSCGFAIWSKAADSCASIQVQVTTPGKSNLLSVNCSDTEATSMWEQRSDPPIRPYGAILHDPSSLTVVSAKPIWVMDGCFNIQDLLKKLVSLIATAIATAICAVTGICTCCITVCCVCCNQQRPPPPPVQVGAYYGGAEGAVAVGRPIEAK